MSILKNCRALAAGVALACAVQGVHATPITYTGTFLSDDEHIVVSFHLGEQATVTATTTSYAQGGFAPMLTLFGAAGGVQQAVGSGNQCGIGPGAVDPATGFCWDARLSADLGAGDYSLVLTQDGNYAIGDTLADGFQQDGFTDYTSWFAFGTAGPLCINADASQRSCNWALAIDGLPAGDGPSGQVPEPGTLVLLGTALLALRRTRRPR